MANIEDVQQRQTYTPQGRNLTSQLKFVPRQKNSGSYLTNYRSNNTDSTLKLPQIVKPNTRNKPHNKAAMSTDQLLTYKPRLDKKYKNSKKVNDFLQRQLEDQKQKELRQIHKTMEDIKNHKDSTDKGFNHKFNEFQFRAKRQSTVFKLNKRIKNFEERYQEQVDPKNENNLSVPKERGMQQEMKSEEPSYQFSEG